MNPLIFTALDLLAKSTGVVLLAFAVQKFWPSASAAQRGAGWLAAFFVLLLLPFMVLLQPRWSFSFRQPESAAPLPELHAEVMQASADSLAAMNQPANSAGLLPYLTAAQWLGFIWLAGFVCLLAQRMSGCLQLHRLKAQSHPLQDARALKCATRVAAEVGLQRGISLRTASCVPVPLTWGTLQPVLLMPAGALHWDDVRLEAALRHEIGHIHHHDALTRLITWIITAAYWPNILVWLAAKAWRTVQEQAADDLVISSGAVAEHYALQLLEAARGVQAAGGLRAPAMAMAQPSTLETRLAAIMDITRDRSPYSMRGALTGLVCGTLVLTLCAVAQLRAAEAKPSTVPANDGGRLAAKASAIILPAVKFKGARLPEIVQFLQAQSIKLDPQHVGLKLVIAEPDYEKMSTITLELHDVPLSEVLKFVAALSNRVVRYAAAAIILSPQSAQGELLTRGYRLPAGATVKLGNVRDWLVSHGVALPEGSSAMYLPDSNQLVVRNTQQELQKVDAAINTLPTGGAGTVGGAAGTVPAGPVNAPASALISRAGAIIIPKIQFQEASVSEALEVLRIKAREFDPTKKGVNILINDTDIPQNTQITLTLGNIPWIEALKYVAELSNLKMKAGENAFVLKPNSAK